MKTLFGVVAFLILTLGCSQSRAPLTQVDAYVWRSGHPESQADWDAIKAKGITDVIELDFPAEDPNAHPEIAAKLGITVHVLSIEPRGDQDVFDDLLNTWKKPDPIFLAEADEILATSGPRKVVLVHCRWGHDRTGYEIFRHRVEHDGWTVAKAYAEAKAMGFHTSLHALNDGIEDFVPPPMPVPEDRKALFDASPGGPEGELR